MSLSVFMQRLLRALRLPLIHMSLYGFGDAVAKGVFRPYESVTAAYSGTPTVNTEFPVDVSSIVPPQAIAVVIGYDFTSGATATVLELYSTTGEAQANKKVTVGGIANLRSTDVVIVNLDSARKFYGKETGAAVATTLKWVGWFERAPVTQPLNIAQF